MVAYFDECAKKNKRNRVRISGIGEGGKLFSEDVPVAEISDINVEEKKLNKKYLA